MPLVPSSTYTAWYSKTSWVYAAYTYLFRNPLWQVNVPKGASLCPLFWLALFSILLFRPLVYITLGLRWFVSLLRLTSFIRWTDKQVLKLTSNDRAAFGVPTTVALIVLGFLSLIITAAVGMALSAFNAGQLIPATAWFVNLIVGLGCSIYCDTHKDPATRCPIEWYMRTSLGVTLLLLVTLHTSAFADIFIGLPLAILGGIWSGLSAAVGGTWWLIKWVLGGALAGAPYALVTFVSLVGLGAIGYLYTRLVPSSAPVEEPEAKLTRAQVDDNVETLATMVYQRAAFTGPASDAEQGVRLHPEAMALARLRPDLCEEDVPSELISSIIDAIRARREAKAARIAQRSEACKRMTAALAKLCSPFTFVWRQVRIAFSYAWALVKARKQGACPYLTFHD